MQKTTRLGIILTEIFFQDSFYSKIFVIFDGP